MKFYLKDAPTALRSLVVVLVLLIVAQSCTVTKRVHRKGWHVEWKSRIKPTESVIAEKKIASINIETLEETAQVYEASPSIERSNNSEVLALDAPEVNRLQLDEIEQNSQPAHRESSTIDEGISQPWQIDSNEKSLNAERSQQNRPSARDWDFAFSLFFFIVAVVLAGLGMLLLLWIQAVSSSALIIFLGIFMFAFWLVGFIALIGSIALLIAGMLA